MKMDVTRTRHRTMQTMRTMAARRMAGRGIAVGVIGLAGIGLAACSSSTTASSSSSTTTRPTSSSAPTPAATSGTATATVDTMHSAGYGTVLVNAAGETLYMLTADTPTTSVCTGACTSVWPPLTSAGAPTAGSGLQGSSLGTIALANGTHQVTYHGHPLYTFVQDTASGQVRGEGIKSFGGTWYVLDAAGNPVTSAVSTTTTTAGSAGY